MIGMVRGFYRTEQVESAEPVDPVELVEPLI